MKNRKLPLAVCHRTNAGGCPENSLSGILAAMALGVDMIELDLQRTADGRLVQGGGPTVKNVSGCDLPRLLVGSLGTVGMLVQVTLRC